MLTIIYSDYAFLFGSFHIFVKERIGRQTWRQFIDGKGINGFYSTRRKSDFSARLLGQARTVQWGSLCRDYHSCGASLLWENEIYVAYVNTENVLMWDKLFAEGRLVLVKDGLWGVSRMSRSHRSWENAHCFMYGIACEGRRMEDMTCA